MSRTHKKFQDMEIHHRNMNILMTYKDGFAPVWEASVRWPGYKNRKYFTSVSAWNKLPSTCIDVVRNRIDAHLHLAWVDVTTASYGIRRYEVKGIMDDNSFALREQDLEGHWLRFNNKETRVEFFNPDTNTWDVYISDEEITQVDFWNRS